MKYYLLRQDVAVPDKWVLGDVRYVNNWHFSDPPVSFMESGNYSLAVRFDGVELDYSLAGYASVPVLSKKAFRSLVGLAEVDELHRSIVFETVRVEGVCSEYFLMIVGAQIDCVDEKKSEYTKFETTDPVRPDMAGQYRSFFNLRVDSEKINGNHIFRIKKYLGAVIVSEEVKRRFEDAGVIGAAFYSVNGDAITVA